MKSYPIFLLFLLLACTHKKKAHTRVTDTADAMHDTITSLQQYKQKFYTTKDTVTIIAASGYDTLRFTREEFNDIIDHFPMLYDTIPYHPDIAYVASVEFSNFVDDKGNNKYISFGSEQGQDVFYILYEYFHQSENSMAAAERKRLIICYSLINGIFNSLNGFGTFFVHQYRRIPAYAAYNTNYSMDETDDAYKRDVSKEKNHFIAMLKDEIVLQVKNDNETLGQNNKRQKIADLFADIKKLDSLITSAFTLHRVCAFRYSYYP